jgi:hypothetical protein
VMRDQPSLEQLATYGHVFDYRGGHFIELRRPWRQGPAPAVVIDRDRPQVFHRGWLPVSQDQPAQPGENLIVQAFDLGVTRPPVPAGRPFPPDPLAEVVSPIEARVNGQRVETSVQIGWPGEIDRYRVDLRIPDRMPRGTAKLALAVNGASGPDVEIPVLPNFNYRPPTIVVTDRPQVFHRDWTPITAEHPAKRGEEIITQAIGLGATRPEVPPRTLFPRDPLVVVVAKIEARVNGEPAGTSTQIGWPGEAGVYRLDIRIPDKTRPGTTKITLAVGGVTGSPTEIPVRK